MKGLYSVIGQRGFYFKNQNGFDGLSGATVQITKNYKTLGEMLGDDGTVFQMGECLGFIDVVDGCWRRNVLVTSVGDARDVDGSGRILHQHPLSFIISVGHQHSNDITNIYLSRLFEKPQKIDLRSIRA